MYLYTLYPQHTHILCVLCVYIRTSICAYQYIISSPVVTRYIQDADLAQSVGKITLLCNTAPSDPAVKCDAIIRCRNGTTINVELDNLFVHNTTQPCNITISVTFRDNVTNEILDQIKFRIPLILPTTTTTPTTTMPPTGKELHYCMHHVCI